jgi:hypothetical protein
MLTAWVARSTCGNPRLIEYVVEQALAAGVPVPAVETFVDAMEAALGAPIESLAAAAREFIAENEARIANRSVPGAEAAPEPSLDSAELRGYLMQAARSEAQTTDAARGFAASGSDARRIGAAVSALLVLAALIVWRSRRVSRARAAGGAALS